MLQLPAGCPKLSVNAPGAWDSATACHSKQEWEVVWNWKVRSGGKRRKRMAREIWRIMYPYVGQWCVSSLGDLKLLHDTKQRNWPCHRVDLGHDTFCKINCAADMPGMAGVHQLVLSGSLLVLKSLKILQNSHLSHLLSFKHWMSKEVVSAQVSKALLTLGCLAGPKAPGRAVAKNLEQKKSEMRQESSYSSSCLARASHVLSNSDMLYRRDWQRRPGFRNKRIQKDYIWLCK